MCADPRILRKAFTLIELLVVIAIIALLVAILVPSLLAAKRIAQRVVCQTHLKHIGLANNMYIQDNLDWVAPDGIATPYVAAGGGPIWDDLIMKYVEGGLVVPNVFRGSWDHVGCRRMTGSQNMTALDSSGNTMTYSKMMGCPSQTKDYSDPWGTSSPSPFYHYVKAHSYDLTQTNANDPFTLVLMQYPPGAVKPAGNRVNDYNDASRFAFFGEPQVWNSAGGAHSPYWQTSNARDIIKDMAVKAVHIGMTNNFCALAGSVFTMTDAQMKLLSPVKTVKQYPFYAQ